MKKYLHYFALALIILLALIVAMSIAVFTWANSDKIKSLITSSIEMQTGMTAQINGSLDLNVFPSAAISIHDVTLSQPNAKTPLMSVDTINAKISWLPLLQLAADQMS